jgi:uncharacterized membrane protein
MYKGGKIQTVLMADQMHRMYIVILFIFLINIIHCYRTKSRAPSFSHIFTKKRIPHFWPEKVRYIPRF